MASILFAQDIERLENTSFASSFAGTIGDPVEAPPTLALCETIAFVCQFNPMTHHATYCGGVSEVCPTLDCNTISLCVPTLECNTVSLCFTETPGTYVTNTVVTNLTQQADALVEAVTETVTTQHETAQVDELIERVRTERGEA